LIDCSGHFIEYLLERQDVVGPWKQHTEHDFVKQLGDGTLPIDKFKVYLIQDYLYLVSGILSSNITRVGEQV
jgi:hydroxymethylpyrimidine/phosphomethylpyrimidine kinase